MKKINNKINKRGKDGMTLLHYACMNGKIKAVEFLLQRGADPLIKDFYCELPLHKAVFHSEVLRFLLKKGIYKKEHLNEKEEYGNTPLHFACEEGIVESVKLLIDFGANVNVENDQGLTPLDKACARGDVEIVKMLVKAGAKVNVPDHNGRILLHDACRRGLLEIVKILVEAGADVNKQDIEGNTPLHLACKSGREEVVEYLLKVGADSTKKKILKQIKTKKESKHE